MRKISIVIWALTFGVIARNSCAFDANIGIGTLDIHGFISQGFLKSDRNNFYAETEDGTFQFNEFGINFSMEPTDRLQIGLQLLSRDLGDIGNNKIELDWAYAAYRWQDWLQISAGMIKVPWGLYNETRDVDMLRTCIFLPSSLYDEGTRDAYDAFTGIGVRGYIPLNFLGELSYQIGYGEQDLSMNGGFVRSLELPPWIETRRMEVRNILGSDFEWMTPLDGLRAGVGLGRYDWEWLGETTTDPFWVSQGIPPGEPLHESNRDIIYRIFSAEYTRGSLMLAVEYTNSSENEEGYYGSVTYQMSDWLTLGAYYSVYYPDKTDKTGKAYEERQMNYLAWQKEFVVTTRIDFNDSWTLKVEGHVMNGTATILPIDNPEGLEKESFLFAVKTTFNF